MNRVHLQDRLTALSTVLSQSRAISVPCYFSAVVNAALSTLLSAALSTLLCDVLSTLLSAALSTLLCDVLSTLLCVVFINIFWPGQFTISSLPPF